MKETISFSSAIFILLIVARLLFAGSGDPMILMTVANVVALDYVMFVVVSSAKHNAIETIQKTHLPLISKKKKKKQLSTYITIAYIGLLLLEVWYVVHLKTSTVNDIISFVALYISIEDTQMKRFALKALKLAVNIE